MRVGRTEAAIEPLHEHENRNLSGVAAISPAPAAAAFGYHPGSPDEAAMHIPRVDLRPDFRRPRIIEVDSAYFSGGMRYQRLLKVRDNIFSKMNNRLVFFIVILIISSATKAANFPESVAGNFVIKDFQFESGEILPKLNQHYRTIGKPTRGIDGKVDNAVLIMHGTAGSGAGFLDGDFARSLFAPGQLLDAAKYFIILPDSIGHGQSSKPSDGLKMNFPKYTYDDMVTAQYRMLTEHLNVDHLRLVMGTSMGGMHTWIWGYMFPDFMDALLPLASTPAEIAGRNRMLRKMIIDSIKNDPKWNNGDYEEPPPGLTYAMHALIFMISSSLQYHKLAPVRQIADEVLEKKIRTYSSMFEANDLIYQFDASRFYDPSPKLDRIKAPLFAINSADDEVNPPELGIMEKEIGKVKNGRYVLLPITDETNGHATYMNTLLWSRYLEDLLKISAK